MSELPPGWVETTLGDITTDCTQRVPAPDEQFQYVDIASVDRATKRIISPQILRGRDAPSRARKVIRTGDVLVSMTRPNLNAVTLVPPEFDQQIASTGFDVLRSIGIESQWLFYVVRSPLFVDRMSELVQGALYPAVRSKDVRGYVVPLPPLNEQKRIADRLDAILARVDACRDRLDRVPAILKRLRQAVLADATSGKLRGEWEDDGRTVTSTIGSVCRLVNGYAYSSKDYQSSGIPLVRISDIDGRYARPSDKIFVPQSLFDEKFLIRKGDILVAMSGATTGKVGIYQSDVPSLQNQRVGNLKITAPERITTGYRNIVLMASSEIILGKAYGGAQPNISSKDIEAFEIWLPPIDQQDEIVRCVEAMFAYADRLEARYTAARGQVERLTPTLLAKAFRGELVPQDPNDKPAAVLLERIRAARAEQSTAKRGRKSPATRVPRAPKEKAAMTKSRQDNDVLHKPYLAGLLRETGGIMSVEDLFRRAELPVTDFYKQLAWEVENGHIHDDETRLEAA